MDYFGDNHEENQQNADGYHDFRPDPEEEAKLASMSESERKKLTENVLG